MDLKPYRPYLIAGLSAALVAAGGLAGSHRAGQRRLGRRRRAEVARRDRLIATLGDASPMARVVALYGLQRLDLAASGDEDLVIDVVRAYLEQPLTETEQRVAHETIARFSPAPPYYDEPNFSDEPGFTDDDLLADVGPPPWETRRPWADTDLDFDEPPPLPPRRVLPPE